MSTAVKRACDACHRRKVKCDGINPCRNCSASQLACTYNAIPQKKGPKGSRAKVINELKETQRQNSLSAKLQNGINGVAAGQTLAPTPRLLTKEMLKACFEFFFAHMYPTMPILDKQRLENDAMYQEQNLDTYCLLTSLCSFVCLQPGMVMPGMPMSDPFSTDMMFGGNIVTTTLLMEETIRVRKGYDYVASPTLNTLCTSFFLFAVHHGLEMHDKAWFHLREAATLAHMLRMNEEQTYLQCDNDSVDATRRRRLYWLLFVTERAYALQHRRPLTLQASITVPPPQEHAADPFVNNGTSFLRLIGLFRGFDELLFPLWMKTRSECSESYLSALDKDLRNVLPPYLNDTQAQLAEMQLLQQWLKHKAWEVSMANGTGNNDTGLSYMNNIHELLPMVSYFPGNLGLHGLSLFEHLLNVTCALTDVLAMLPAPRTAFTPGPHDELRKILNIVTVVRNGEHRFLPLLLKTVHAALPKLASPMLQNAPVPESSLPSGVDIFDGFGTAGMAQPPVYQAADFDNKFAVPRLDELSSDSNSPSGGPRDVSSPFATTSSAIMSPGIEMSHGLPTDITSMPEMVMSPISHAPPSSLGTPGGMNSQSQHSQRSPMSPFPNSNPHMQGLNGANINPPPNISLNSQMHLNQGIGGGMGTNNLTQPVGNNNLLSRMPPQRSNSFAMGVPQIRTIGDFQALQRANTDAMGNSLGMNSMSQELDFNTLPR